MRNAVVQLVFVLIGITSIHAARYLATSSFHFRIDPVGPADKVEAIQGRDTMQMTPTNGGYYVQSVNPGRWLVLVRAAAPYKDCRYNLIVGPGRNIDIGTLRLLTE